MAIPNINFMSEKKSRGWELPSQEEAKEQGSNYTNVPLESEDYIVKIAKIIFEKKPTWNQKTKSFDLNNLKWVYTVIALPYSLKTGDEMTDINGKEVVRYSRWIWREINPYAIGFLPDNATPSMLRALLCYMTGQSPQGRIKPEGFILLDPEGNIEESEKIRKEIIEEQSEDLEDRTLTKKGYKIVPDIRMYEGEFISCSIEADAKGNNKLTRFSKLPASFKVKETSGDKEVLEKFEESVEKMMEKKGGKNTSSKKSKKYSEDEDEDEEEEYTKKKSKKDNHKKVDDEDEDEDEDEEEEVEW